jgi:quinol monooxygenase YgiN
MGYMTTVRARLRNPDQGAAMQHHNDIVAKLRPQGEPLGGVGHSTFAKADDPRDFLALDRWDSMEGLQKFMGDPAVQQEIASLFEGPPEVTVWAARDGWTAY